MIDKILENKVKTIWAQSPSKSTPAADFSPSNQSDNSDKTSDWLLLVPFAIRQQDLNANISIR